MVLFIMRAKSARHGRLAARVSQLLHKVLTTDDDRQKEAAVAEAKAIFATRPDPD
jgi:hypothetical protein